MHISAPKLKLVPIAIHIGTTLQRGSIGSRWATAYPLVQRICSAAGEPGPRLAAVRANGPRGGARRKAISIQRLFAPQASSLGALPVRSIRTRRPLAPAFADVKVPSREVALLSAIPNNLIDAPLTFIATGVHAQHSSFEADVRARVYSVIELANAARCLVAAFPRLGRVVPPLGVASTSWSYKKSWQQARWRAAQPSAPRPRDPRCPRSCPCL